MSSEAVADNAIRARADAALQVPLQRALGAELIDAADPSGGVRFPVRDLAVTPAGTLHAGALNTILELAGYLAVAPTLAAGEHAVTHAIAAQFVRAAPRDVWVRVYGELTKRGRTLAFVTVTATLEDSPATVIATGQITKSVVAAPGGS
ncbi:PaaI family thioesterase [Nocardia blacklockiae]|uniref:PaaI family thioesterase n=1 Tax=Nocardia blacklockiae TaxID=480036 RepID=UPI001894A6EB|nr:PaaI family thioesterase [Nocardia blacklockiae]MBF6174431.1 PaaI family thioesterase [Nocardia blacklockiae]